MGTDIHMWAEIRKSGVNEWTLVGREFANPYTGALVEHPCSERNSDLFEMLAGVRSDSGYVTGDGFVPVAQPRGLPDDMSGALKRRAKFAGHATWLGLDELDAYDWTQTTRRRGIVSAKQYRIFKESGSPNEWSGSVFGDRVLQVSNEDMDRFFDNPLTVPSGKYLYTIVDWPITYADAAGSFYTQTLPKFREIRARDRVTDLRLVMYFDS